MLRGVCDDVHQTMYKMPRRGKYQRKAYEKETFKDGIAKFKSCVYMAWYIYMYIYRYTIW